MSFRELVFSGVQPTGNLHLGNYLGAIKRFVELQDRYDCIYCIVDLHAITVWQDPTELPRAIREVTAAFIACGIDPKKHIVFNQSQVAEHAELAWVFNCIARLGWLNRMTQFKEKAGKDRENASVGLYAYPTLMAADILVYRATHVPVGEDQKQHLELARDIAQKFNNDFSESIRANGFGDAFFPLPEPLITGEATRVMSLREGVKKMSKSDASDQSRINLTDDADTIALKIRRAKTDPLPLPSEEQGLQNRPEANNLVGIFAALADTSRTNVLRQFGNAPFSTFKNALTELAVEKLSPIAAEMEKLLRDPATIDEVLADGAARAQIQARQTVNAVKDIVGFVRKPVPCIEYSQLSSMRENSNLNRAVERKLFARRQTEAAISHFYDGEWDTAVALAATADKALEPSEGFKTVQNLTSHSHFHEFFERHQISIPETLFLRLREARTNRYPFASEGSLLLELQSALLIQEVIRNYVTKYNEKPGLFRDFVKWLNDDRFFHERYKN
jgi:tryptophanyl-tRNA synthetase